MRRRTTARGGGKATSSHDRGSSNMKTVQLSLLKLGPPVMYGLKAPYDAQLTKVYRGISGSIWDANKTMWIIPDGSLKDAEQCIRQAGWTLKKVPSFLSPRLMESDYFKMIFSNGCHKDEARMVNVPRDLQEGLYDHQLQAINFALRRGGRILIADEAGTGKTASAIGVACAYAEEWPLLIVCPGTVKANWKKELLQWVPWFDEYSVEIVKGGDNTLNNSAQVFIVTYDIMPRLASKGCFRSRTFKVVIADESHAIKTLDAQRTVATLPVLQGTPVLSRPAEIFTTLRALLPNVYLESDWIPFADRYCDAKHGRFGLDTSGCSNSSELKLLLEGTVMLRRLKRDVLKQLPEKKREVITVRISQAQRPELDELLAEKKANDAAIKEAKSIGDDNTLFRLDARSKELISKLYKVTGTGKIDSVVEWLLDKIRYISSAELFHCGFSAIAIHYELKCEPIGLMFRNGAFFSRRKPESVLKDDQDDTQTTLLVEERERTAEQVISGAVVIAPPSPSIAIPESKREKMRNTTTKQPSEEKEELGQNNLVNHEKSKGLKLLVFAHHQSVLDAIMGALTCRAGLNVIRIDGNTPMNKRQALVEKFQNDDDTHVCLLAITAAGIGITLTAASMAVFAELSWTPGCMTQAEDRIHRIGQTAEEVSIVYLVAERSVDQQMLNSLQRKQATLKSTTGLAKEELGFSSNIEAASSSCLQRPRKGGGVDVGQRSISDVFNSFRHQKVVNDHSSTKGRNPFSCFSTTSTEHQPPTSTSAMGPATSSMGDHLPPTDQASPLNLPPVSGIGTGTDTGTASTEYLSPEVKAQVEASRQRALERLKLKQLQRKHPN